MDHGTQVHVGGEIVGQVVVGEHRITVRTEQSAVTAIAPSARPRPVRRPVITLLPRQPARPEGRDRELAVLGEAGRLTQVFGPPGTGKSTLIRYVAGQLGSGVVFLSAAGRTVGDLLQDVFEACYDIAGYRPAPVELRRLMSDVDIRLLIDDLNVRAGELDELLDAVPNASVIFTSERRSPRAAQALELPARDWPLPQAVTGLPPAAREVASILAIADSPISAALLPWLVSAPVSLTDAVTELAARGVVLISERGCQLAPTVPTEAFPGLPRLDWIAARLRECARQLPPLQVAYHAPLITSVVDAAVRLGRPDVGAQLAKATAPIAACSGRLGAWARILDRGKLAARRAGDRPTLAYLTHEDGIRSLVTGRRTAAAAAIGTATALWHQLGYPAHAALAEQLQSIIAGRPVPRPRAEPLGRLTKPASG